MAKKFGINYNQLYIPHHIFHFTSKTIDYFFDQDIYKKVAVKPANIPVITQSIFKLLKVKISDLGLLAALTYPFQIVVDILSSNHTAIIIVIKKSNGEATIIPPEKSRR